MGRMIYDVVQPLAKGTAMVNTTLDERLTVSDEGTVGPYILLPSDQIERVEKVLSRAGIRHWSEDNVISMNGHTEIGAIHLGHSADVAAVQAVLDDMR